jgi:predicted peptidase
MVTVAAAASRPAVAASINDFVQYSYFDTSNTRQLPGLLHVPAGYAINPSAARPLILFLHGAGESGTNNLLQINSNIDNLLAAAKTRDAFLYAPQTNIGWGNSTLLSHAMTMIDRAISDRNVDPNRIYVTGLSMGGGGVWNFGNLFADRVAASVPVCAVYPTSSFRPSIMIDEPIWAFHGRSDTVVPVQVTREVINTLVTEAGLPIPTYPATSNTFFPNTRFDFPPTDLHYTDMRGNHDIWFQVYNQSTNGAMYDWMFSHGVVPEPGTIGLLAIGAVSLICGRRWR